MTEIDKLRSDVADLTKGFTLLAEYTRLATQCEVTTAKQLADLQLEIAAIKFSRDDSAL